MNALAVVAAGRRLVALDPARHVRDPAGHQPAGRAAGRSTHALLPGVVEALPGDLRADRATTPGGSGGSPASARRRSSACSWPGPRCEIVGWGLIWWGLRGGFDGAVATASATPGTTRASSTSPSASATSSRPSGVLRVLTVVEGLSGLGTLGLVIGFLPILNAAYSARERQLLLLDDLTDARITPVSLVRSHLGRRRRHHRARRHVRGVGAVVRRGLRLPHSLPMLMWFRSKHRGHSWITGLGRGDRRGHRLSRPRCRAPSGGPAMRLHRQSGAAGDRPGRTGRRAAAAALPTLDRAAGSGRSGYTAHAGAPACPMRDFDESFAPPHELRARVPPDDGGVHRRAAGAPRGSGA